MPNQDTIHHWFEAEVAMRPYDIALEVDGSIITYQVFNQKVNQLAWYLKKNKVGRETPVAVCMTRSLDLLITIFAIIKAGGFYIPLDPTNPEVRLTFILEDTNAPLLITKHSFKKKFSAFKGKLLFLDKDKRALAKSCEENPPILIQPDNLAYIIYTSGSTGKPKGVLIEHKSLINYVRWFKSYSACSPQARIDFSANYTFDMSVSCCVVPLLIGLTIIVGKEGIKNEAGPYLTYLAKNKVNIIKISPSYLKVLSLEVKNNPCLLPHLTTVILGGESLSTSDCAIWLDNFPHHILINEYGPTEATIAATEFKVTNENRVDLGIHVPIGQPGLNMSCYIVDENDVPVKKGEIGELYIGGMGLARGYLNRLELTEKSFIEVSFTEHKEKVYKTGDLCRWLANGNIEYLGRKDGQVKIRGYRIEPSEIEKCLSTHPSMHATIVLGRDTHLNEKQLIAYFILKDKSIEPSSLELKKFLSQFLPDYMLPAAFVRVDALPLTSNDKLDIKALPNPQFISEQYYLPPKNSLEKMLTELWVEELGLTTVGVEDDFFELGGHSLSAARIISKLNAQLKKDISIAELYSAPTIRKLTKIIKKNKLKRRSRRLKNQLNKMPLLLNDFQHMLWLSTLFEPDVKKLNISTRKRLAGRLDINTLNQAFTILLAKHEILSLHISSLRPTQRIEKKQSPLIEEEVLTHLDEKRAEIILSDSYKSLLAYYPWDKKSPLILIRLFYLPNHMSELQICMPHIVSDDLSSEIVFNDLSKFYLQIIESRQPKLAVCKQYIKNTLTEQQHLHKYVDRDIRFWDDYLKDAHSFILPPEWVVRNTQDSSYYYSTYTPLPQEALTQLQRFCAKNKVSIHDGLCAAIVLALQKKGGRVPSKTDAIFLNIVKSTRDNDSFNEAIGCFLRLEPIKIKFNGLPSLENYAKQAHQATIETQLYQPCSGIIKLASMAEFRQPRTLRTALYNGLVSVYTTFFGLPRYMQKILNIGTRLGAFKRDNHFVLNINVQSQFVSGKEATLKEATHLFGLKVHPTPALKQDLSTVKSFFDVCFLREENIPYLVISANIMPVHRIEIAREIVQIIESSALHC